MKNKNKNLGRRLPAPGTRSPSPYSWWCTGSSGSGRVFSFNHHCVIFRLEQVAHYNDDIGWKLFFITICCSFLLWDWLCGIVMCPKGVQHAFLCSFIKCILDSHLCEILFLPLWEILLCLWSSPCSGWTFSNYALHQNILQRPTSGNDQFVRNWKRFVKKPGCQLLPRYWSPPQAHIRLWRI